MGRLIDADELSMWLKRLGRFLKVEEDHERVCRLVGKIINHIEADTAATAVDIVTCKECVLHDNCIMEDSFKLAGIENPFCCVGFRKEGADNG